ncbi:long-chain-fatty-acid--CoA ligase [Paenibacillus albicereus]|uniref:Long-chain-fatty-acid--CoA ligase n=1 Tax=Paenibacillus albicereus TaxID=2726185 RepID=A0A6H2GTH9_9BACL|nr:long-chain-fatty-acid--CoA ligase [Paenibacillus albicereus]QJC50733.1 long-chain-fatty-acid--CoA ligase [Paenibacillus albicereus]
MSWNLVEALETSAASFPDREAYVYQGASATYAELIEEVRRCAAGLAAQGIVKGDKVVLLLGNAPEFIVSLYGALSLGAIVVPVNPTYTADELAYILADSGARAAVAAAPLRPLIAALQARLPRPIQPFYVGEEEGEASFARLLQLGAGQIESAYIKEEDTAVILYTSGTTGKPKGAMLSHRNLATNAESVYTMFEVTERDRAVTVLPMFHIYSLTVCLNAPLAVGACIVILPRFHPVETIAAIREQRATMFSGVPTMYAYLLQVPGASAADFATLRLCSSGGASLPVEVLHKVEERFGVVVYEGYGLSEAAPVTAFNPLGGKRKPGSVGVDIPRVTNRIVDPEGREVPRGEIGELIVQGPNVMQGYYNLPEATAEALRDGWLHTGDIARMDEEGYIYIVDRMKDMINVGGFNVYPREVEEVLYRHPGVFEAAVVGVPDVTQGEAVKAYVVRSDEALTAEELAAFCSGSLVKYKRPTSIEFLPELPKNSSGKTLRRALKLQAQQPPSAPA